MWQLLKRHRLPNFHFSRSIYHSNLCILHNHKTHKSLRSLTWVKRRNYGEYGPKGLRDPGTLLRGICNRYLRCSSPDTDACHFNLTQGFCICLCLIHSTRMICVCRLCGIRKPTRRFQVHRISYDVDWYTYRCSCLRSVSVGWVAMKRHYQSVKCSCRGADLHILPDVDTQLVLVNWTHFRFYHGTEDIICACIFTADAEPVQDFTTISNHLWYCLHGNRSFNIQWLCATYLYTIQNTRKGLGYADCAISSVVFQTRSGKEMVISSPSEADGHHFISRFTINLGL